MKIAILYGWAEGSWHAKKLLPYLKKHNLVLSNDAISADVILCHSGGCYMVPETKAKLIVLIGPPYWPKKSMTLRIIKKTYRDFLMHHSIKELKFWWAKSIHNIFYMLLHFPKWVSMHINWKKEAFPKSTEKKIIVIRNKNDKFCQLSAIKNLQKEINGSSLKLRASMMKYG